jgi:cation transport regulator ChaB
MPRSKRDIPDTLERSPAKVRRTYEKTLESAEEQYGDEERAHRTAWASVKHVAEKHGDHWELKDEPGPSEDKDTSSNPRVRRRGFTHGGIDTRKSKAALYRDAVEADIEGRSKMTKAELVHALERYSDRETARARA